MSKKNKATQAAQAERDNKAALDSVMSADTGNTNPTYTQADAQEESEMENRYKSALAEIDAKEEAERDEMRRKYAALDAVMDDNGGHFRLADAPRMETALATLNNVAESLDISPIRSKYADKFDNQTLIDNLTAFETASIMETAAMPVMRVTAIARIKLNADAMRAVKGTIMPDGSGKTYGTTKAPLSRFLADTLNLRKQQITDYMSVVDNCMIGDVLKDVYNGYNFTQMSLLSRADNPDAAAAALAEHASDSVSDFKKALSAYVTANKVLDADGVTVGGETSGQPDESSLTHYVYFGFHSAMCSGPFSPALTDDDKPAIIRAAKVADAVQAMITSLNENPALAFRMPKATFDSISGDLEKACNPYKPVAVVVDIMGTVKGSAPFIAIAQVITQGSAPTDETPKAAAKRIKTQGAILEKWLTGALEIANIPAAITLAGSALSVYSDAKKRLEKPRMSAYDALKQAIDNITLKETPKA